MFNICELTASLCQDNRKLRVGRREGDGEGGRGRGREMERERGGEREREKKGGGGGKESGCFHSRDSMQEVLGRCTVDVRVCASPGRDRDVDEKKMRGEDTSTPDASNKPPPPSTRRGRKRGMK